MLFIIHRPISILITSSLVLAKYVLSCLWFKDLLHCLHKYYYHLMIIKTKIYGLRIIFGLYLSINCLFIAQPSEGVLKNMFFPLTLNQWFDSSVGHYVYDYFIAFLSTNNLLFDFWMHSKMLEIEIWMYCFFELLFNTINGFILLLFCLQFDSSFVSFIAIVCFDFQLNKMFRNFIIFLLFLDIF